MLAKQRSYAKYLIAVAVALASVLLIGLNARAEEADNNVANALRVSPVRTDITADPGQTKIVNVNVTNPSREDVEVRAIQNDFVADGEDGTPAIILDEDEYAPKHSLKRFMQPIENVTVPAGETVTVRVRIVVPSNADAGGYFGALRFAPTSPNEGGQVSTSASVASLILLRVNGEVAERLELTDFSVHQNSKVGTFFTSDNNINVMFRFKNDGAVQLGPLGRISVKKGDDVVYETDFNNKDQRDMVLPDSARRWMIPLEGIDGFGHYTVTATFTYGTKNQTVDATESFWVVPMWMIATAAGLVVVLVGAIVGFIVYRRKNPRKISLGSSKRR